MAQALKRRVPKTRRERNRGSILSLLLVVVLLFGGTWYLSRVVLTGDWAWFQSSFDGQARQITVINRGQRTEIGRGDPRFEPLNAAFNESVSQGYRHAAMGFSEPTWDLVDRNGLLVELSYAEPVRLHGNFQPTTKMLLLISGDLIHTTEVLFRYNETDWDPGPYRVSTVEPLKRELARFGFEQ